MSARYPHDDETCRQNSIDAASFPDLCRQVASLKAERDELRATVARVEALGRRWSDPSEPLGIIGLPWANEVREALAGGQP